VEYRITPVTDTPEPSYILALEEARRGFDQLAGEIDVIRNRAVSTLGMGGLAASLLGGLSIRDGVDLTGWTGAAVAAFVVLAALCVATLWPRRFHVTLHPGELVAWVEEDKGSSSETERDLALWLRKKYDQNRPKVDHIGWLSTAASAAFLVEVAAWLSI
jgi:hypothetical protein